MGSINGLSNGLAVMKRRHTVRQNYMVPLLKVSKRVCAVLVSLSMPKCLDVTTTVTIKILLSSYRKTYLTEQGKVSKILYQISAQDCFICSWTVEITVG